MIPNDKYIDYNTSPSSRSFIITDELEYNRFFSKSELDIDFEKEILIFHIFSDVNPYRNYNLKGIDVNDKVLFVKIELEHKSVDDATMPYQRCIAIKMKK